MHLVLLLRCHSLSRPCAGEEIDARKPEWKRQRRERRHYQQSRPCSSPPSPSTTLTNTAATSSSSSSLQPDAQPPRLRRVMVMPAPAFSAHPEGRPAPAEARRPSAAPSSSTPRPEQGMVVFEEAEQANQGG